MVKHDKQHNETQYHRPNVQSHHSGTRMPLDSRSIGTKDTIFSTFDEVVGTIGTQWTSPIGVHFCRCIETWAVMITHCTTAQCLFSPHAFTAVPRAPIKWVEEKIWVGRKMSPTSWFGHWFSCRGRDIANSTGVTILAGKIQRIFTGVVEVLVLRTAIARHSPWVGGCGPCSSIGGFGTVNAHASVQRCLPQGFKIRCIGV